MAMEVGRLSKERHSEDLLVEKIPKQDSGTSVDVKFRKEEFN
jgi:hypothetical protein